MIYQSSITIGTAVSSTDPTITRLALTKGLIYRVEVEWAPPGTGLAGAAIFDGGAQIWPSIRGEWFIDDGHLLGFDDLYLKEVAPFELQIKTYNTDTEFTHLVMIRVGLVSKEAFMARFMPTTAWEKFEETLARLREEQLQVFSGPGFESEEKVP